MKKRVDVVREIMAILNEKAMEGHHFEVASFPFTFKGQAGGGNGIVYVNSQSFANVDMTKQFDCIGDFSINGRYVHVMDSFEEGILCDIILRDIETDKASVGYKFVYEKDSEASELAADTIFEHLVMGRYPATPINNKH